MKVLIKSKFIYNGRQVENKTVDMTQEEVNFLSNINVKYEIKKDKSEVSRKRIQDEGNEPGD